MYKTSLIEYNSLSLGRIISPPLNIHYPAKLHLVKLYELPCLSMIEQKSIAPQTQTVVESNPPVDCPAARDTEDTGTNSFAHPARAHRYRMN